MSSEKVISAAAARRAILKAAPHLAYIIDELPQVDAAAVAHGKWISVKDRLPKEGEDVLVVVCASYDTWVTIDCLMRDGRWCVDADKKRITHWMPLPQPPKGE